MGYYIVHDPAEKERSIMKEKEWERWWFMGKVWTKKRAWAKKFFHKGDAESALVIIKMKWWLKEEEPERPIKPKELWHG